MNFQSLDIRRPAGGLIRPGRFSVVTLDRAVKRPFLAVMAVTAAMAAIYYALIAAPLYVSEASITIHSQSQANPLTMLQSLGGGGAGITDLVAVQDHIESSEMLDVLEKQHHLRAAYSRFRPDFLHWLRPDADKEAFLRFYNHMVTVKLDRQANIIEVDVRAFDPASAPAVAETILRQTEDFVDGMTQRVRTESLRDAQTELNRAELEAQKARMAVANSRGAAQAADPAAAAALVQGGEAALDAQAAEAQAEVASALTFNRPDSPVVRQLQARLGSIQAQAAQLKARQAGGPAHGLPGQITNYETLALQRAAAEQKLTLARAAYESARLNAEQREKYVVRVVNPNHPDRPSEPRRFLDFLTVMLFALTAYAIVSLSIAAVRDHRGV